MDKFGDLRQLSAGFLDCLDVRRSFGQTNNGLRDRGSRRFVPGRCRGKREEVRPAWRAPESAGTGPPASACCNTGLPRARRRRRESGAALRLGAAKRGCSCGCSPAQTGTRPAAASMTMRMVWSHSCSSRVAASPVDPQATMKSIPASICQFTSAQSAGSSIVPSTLKGVTIAVPQPVVSIMKSVYRYGSIGRCDEHQVYSDSSIDMR